MDPIETLQSLSLQFLFLGLWLADEGMGRGAMGDHGPGDRHRGRTVVGDNLEKGSQSEFKKMERVCKNGGTLYDRRQRMFGSA